MHFFMGENPVLSVFIYIFLGFALLVFYFMRKEDKEGMIKRDEYIHQQAQRDAQQRWKDEQQRQFEQWKYIEGYITEDEYRRKNSNKNSKW